MLRVGTAELSGIYDPWFSSTAYDVYVQDLIFDYLIGFDGEGKPVPEMADYTVSGDRLTYTFKLKEDLRYSDGSPVVSGDFAFALMVYADPSYDGFYDFSSLGIVGYDDFQSGDAQGISGVTTPDDRTLSVTLERPSLSAVYSLGLPAMSRAYYGADYQKGDLSGVKAKTAVPFGSGQYTYVSETPGQSLTLKANPLHYRGRPNIGTCIFSVTPAGMELERVLLGETDIECSYAEPDYIEQANKSAGVLETYIFPYSGFGYIGLNDALPMFSDALTRQALACAIDRAGVTKLVYGENAKVIHAPVSRLSWAYSDAGLDPYSYDLGRAAALLQQAGWEKNTRGILARDGEEFSLTFSIDAGNPVSEALAMSMLDGFSQLGINFRYETIDFNAMYDKIYDGTIQMWFSSLGFVPDPSVTPLYHTGGVLNFGCYTNSEVDALMEKIDACSDEARQKELYAELWRELNRELPAIFLYQRDEMWVASNRLQGLTIDSYNSFFRCLYKAEIDQSS
jgi:peptide/nickel transport system substrate-binding protein